MLERALFAIEVALVVVSAGMVVACDCVFLGCITTGMRPVLVLTMGPRLILTLFVVRGCEMDACVALLGLLLDCEMDARVELLGLPFDCNVVVKAVFESNLPELGREESLTAVFSCFLGWLFALMLDLREAIVYALVVAGFLFSVTGCVGPLSTMGCLATWNAGKVPPLCIFSLFLAPFNVPEEHEVALEI